MKVKNQITCRITCLDLKYICFFPVELSIFYHIISSYLAGVDEALLLRDYFDSVSKTGLYNLISKIIECIGFPFQIFRVNTQIL